MIRYVKGQVLLVLVAAIWGFAYSITKPALNVIDPFTFMAGRFFLAGLVILPLIKIHELNKENIFQGIFTGIFLYLVFIFTFLGLITATVTATGFITSLYVVWVPIINVFINREFPDSLTILGVFCAVLGIGFISISRNFSIGTGELFVLAGSISMAIYIVLVSKYVGSQNHVNLAAIQIWTIAILGTLIVLLKGGVDWQILTQPIVYKAICFNGIVASALTLILQNYAQKYVSPSHVSIILCTEPIFAAIFARFINCEQVKASVYIGCCWILCAMSLQMFSEIKRSNNQINCTYSNKANS